MPLNCVFHVGDLLITDFGDVTAVTADAPMEGRLWRVEVGVAGMPLYRGAIRPRAVLNDRSRRLDTGLRRGLESPPQAG